MVIQVTLKCERSRASLLNVRTPPPRSATRTLPNAIAQKAAEITNGWLFRIHPAYAASQTFSKLPANVGSTAHGAVRLHGRHAAHGLAPHIEYKSREDSEAQETLVE